MHLATTFQFAGHALGPWDVVVSNPDGSTATLKDGLTLEEPQAPQVWVDIIGSDRIRPGRPLTYTLQYGNRGNVNAVGIPIWVTFPKNATVQLVTPLQPLKYPAGDTFDYSRVPEILEGKNEKFMALMAPLLPPGAMGHLRFRVSVSTETEFEITAWANDSFYTPALVGSPTPLQSTPHTPDDCLKAALSTLMAEAMNRLIERVAPVDCINESIKAAQTVIHETYNAIDAGSRGDFSEGVALASASKILTAGLKAGIECGGKALELAFPEAKIAFAVADALSLAIDLWRIIDNCKDAFPPQNPKKKTVQPSN